MAPVLFRSTRDDDAVPGPRLPAGAARAHRRVRRAAARRRPGRAGARLRRLACERPRRAPRERAPLGRDRRHDRGAPAQGPGADLASWYAESAELLLDALDAAGPEDRCWHFGGTEKTKAFWYRRQVHETAVHLADSGSAHVLDPAVAADGVDEVLGALLPRVTRWHAVPELPGPVTLRATDTGDVWTVHPGEPPVLGPAAGSASVEAPARDLLLRLWKRTGPDPRVDGAAATALLEAPLTP
ncbi:maleylpyruvate isomerase N-terminal domain-containing protein [Amycolatopsis sp. OK19-0408]|uniref:Maleylpyruvate isomerase N-terminal domain-containing protein n=1 Tax=Amycolatopsis iheyensis TaxID=2945988 RepID=A0A9X2NAY1_9PSEU|nr:maleylpyruvate isomerase N-terminal domain-containing protein [Amycolatopsis iheyensis]MCR6483349.1 maleylpyruvate isomerase N-terminal domain-containing protein [Amycolatopsis iheyensis]